MAKTKALISFAYAKYRFSLDAALMIPIFLLKATIFSLFGFGDLPSSPTISSPDSVYLVSLQRLALSILCLIYFDKLYCIQL